ncbi:hypothetical protein [Photobacterium leiognathi]|uniref:hypothetical protein n=1 Tax=Photobacterium leiognathi TaxID=553611 RepID=UPI002981C8D1|nr:hypothetical protein [Photobacterium leiognathi]
MVTTTMFKFYNKQRISKSALFIVGWVICICLATNMNIFHGCKAQFQDNNQSTIVSADGSHLDLDSSSNSEASDKCHLSEHLINFDQHQFDNHVIVSFLAFIAIVILLTSSPPYFPPFTEPIFAKGRRTHLQICVFRE